MSRFILALVLLFSPLAVAQDDDSPSYMALVSHEVNMRVGPGREYSIKWIYKRRHLPFEVIEQVPAGWVRVRAHDGQEGWISRHLLTPRRTVRVQSYRVAVHRRANEGSRIIANLQEGVVGELNSCNPVWCQISVESIRGWVKREHLWGVDHSEIF